MEYSAFIPIKTPKFLHLSTSSHIPKPLRCKIPASVSFYMFNEIVYSSPWQVTGWYSGLALLNFLKPVAGHVLVAKWLTPSLPKTLNFINNVFISCNIKRNRLYNLEFAISLDYQDNRKAHLITIIWTKCCLSNRQALT